jgi:hypothetical protein
MIDTKTHATTLMAMTEMTPEDLAKYNTAAIRLAQDLAPGESARWADLVNTAASMGKSTTNRPTSSRNEPSFDEPASGLVGPRKVGVVALHTSSTPSL